MAPGVVRGALVGFEGLDRSGKSTQVSLLEQRLLNLGKPVKVMRFPDRSTPIGQMIDTYLKKKADTEDHAIHLLFTANRWELAQRILDLLSSGTTVLCDRYYYSGMIYSAAKQNPALSMRWARASEIGLPRPDVVFFLDLDEATAKARGGWGDEVYEKLDFQSRVRRLFTSLKTGALELNSDSGSTDDIGTYHEEQSDMVFVDAGRSTEQVTGMIWEHLEPKLAAVENGSCGREVRIVS